MITSFDLFRHCRPVPSQHVSSASLTKPSILHCMHSRAEDHQLGSTSVHATLTEFGTDRINSAAITLLEGATNSADLCTVTKRESPERGIP